MNEKLVVTPITKKLLHTKEQLERELKAVKKELKSFEEQTKSFFKKNNCLRMDYEGFTFTYTPPRRYLSLAVDIELLGKVHPDFVVRKEGYESLRIKRSK